MNTSSSQPNDLRGWGVKAEGGSEIWDTDPIFLGDRVTYKDRLKLLFYPKKLFLFRYIEKAKKKQKRDTRHPFRILDIGCGTGAAIIEMKKIFGREVEIVGVDVVHLQIDLGKTKLKKHGVHAELMWYDGTNLPFGDQSFDAVYTSDVLGHVADVPAWLAEVSRVTKDGGVLAMFSESALGKHAYIRNHMLKKGVNTDPHAEFHISLFSKTELQDLITKAGFTIENMWTTVWLKFLVHPDELHPALQKSKGLWLLRLLNNLLFNIKRKLHPYSTAAAELYSLIEMVTIGRFVESQGYVILGKKRQLNPVRRQRN